MPRRLAAEVLYDAIHLATGSRQHFPGLPAGLRAAELPDAGVADPFLDDFGRPVRESSCECERSSGMVLGPIMKLVNGPTVSNAINDPNSELTKLVAALPDDTELIREVFLRFIARQPNADEIQLGLEAMQAAAPGMGGGRARTNRSRTCTDAAGFDCQANDRCRTSGTLLSCPTG